MKTDEILATAKEAAILAGKLNRIAFRSAQHTIESKGAVDANTVTQADRATEEALRNLIRERHPDHAFFGEESGDPTGRDGSIGTKGPLWIVDPIDGTNNFIHGFPHYGVSVAFAIDGEVHVAVCLDVERNELFWGIRGQGAWLDGQPIRSSEKSSPVGALIITGFYYERGEIMQRTLRAIGDLFGAGIHGIRRTGSAVIDICWVASGRADAFFELVLKPWDFLGAALIAREAGAAATDCEGEPLCITSNSVIIGESTLVRHISEIVTEA